MRKRGLPFALGQSIIMFIIIMLLYTYFYHTYYSFDANTLSPFSTEVWSSSILLSLMTVFAGVLIELSRFWGWVIQYKFKQELLILQGIPSGILGLIPSTIWTMYFGSEYPFNFLADPAVTGAAGVWFGVILMRSFFEHKKVEDEEEEEEKEKKHDYFTG